MLPHGWLFPGQSSVEPISTRRLNRAVRGRRASRTLVRPAKSTNGDHQTRATTTDAIHDETAQDQVAQATGRGEIDRFRELPYHRLEPRLASRFAIATVRSGGRKAAIAAAEPIVRTPASE
jgi:hypothetical protein